MTDGVSQGKRPELVGGGLSRSLAGDKSLTSEPLYDERVLGGSEFIRQLRQDNDLREKLLQSMKLPELIQRVEKYFGLTPGQIGKRSRSAEVMTVRDLFCYVAERVLMCPGTEVGACLNIRRSAVSHAVRRGGVIFAETTALIEGLIIN